jgi:tripartite-type tricarboxylate transporter receptor subunit TctC
MKPASLLLAVPLFALSAALAAQGTDYPNRAIKLVSPYPAGGAADTVARVVGQVMSESLGQPIVVENRAGADGNIGAKFVASSPNDGYTILIGDVGNLTMGPAVRKSVPYDAIRDFVPIAQLVSAPNILVVNPAVPAKTFAEFIAYAKANPGKINYASSGTGGSAHLAGELLKKAVGIDIVHVPYKGAGPAVTDVLRGDVQAMFGLSVVLPHVKDGKLRPLATTGLRRTKFLPDIPTIAESGFPGFEATAWYGLLAPAGTPQPIINKLHEAAIGALKNPAVRERLEGGGYEIVGSSPEEFSAYIKSEQKKWSDIVQAAGIKVEE